MTALGDSAHGNVDETHFENHKFQVRFDEADVGFSIISAGETSQQSNWLEGYQVMLPGPGEETRTCAKDSNVAKLEENRRVYWLPGSAADNTDGAPLITDGDLLILKQNSMQHSWKRVKNHADSNTRQYYVT